MLKISLTISFLLALMFFKVNGQATDNCITLLNSTIEIKEELSKNACLNAIASSNVDVQEGFDSQNADFFEAQINNYASITKPVNVTDYNCTSFRLKNNSDSKTISLNYLNCNNENKSLTLTPLGISDCFQGNPYKASVSSNNNSNNIEIYLGCETTGNIPDTNPPEVVNPPVVINPPDVVNPPAVINPPDVVNPPVIVNPPIVTPPPTIEPPVVVEPPVANAECENFKNHSILNPHLGARTSTNEYFGQTYAKSTPEYKIEGQTGWKKCILIENTGKKYNYYGILEPYQGVERNIWLRTREGCEEFPDIRNQKPYEDRLRDWVALPSLPVLPKNNDKILFYISTDIEGANLTNDNLPIWDIYSPSVQFKNLKRKLNGKNEKDFVTNNTFSYTNNPSPSLISSPYEYLQKDFVLDITNDNWQTSQRFVVHRSYFGGHYSTICTLTRHDGYVIVSSEVISPEIEQVLIDKNTGEKYYSNNIVNGIFEIGFKNDGDYNFELRTKSGFLVEPDVLIRVKKMD